MVFLSGKIILLIFKKMFWRLKALCGKGFKEIYVGIVTL